MPDMGAHLRPRASGWSVRTRFVLIVAVVLGLVAITVFQYYPNQLAVATREALDDRAHSLARTVGLGVGVGLEAFELAAITEAVEVARSDPDLRVVIVRDVDGNLIGEFRTDSLEEADDENVLRVVEAIVYQGEPLGEVELVMSLEALEAAIAAHRRNGLLICAGIFIIGILLTAAAARPITAPLAELAKAADEVALGNLDAPLPEPRDREVHQLADAFQHMRGQVKDALHGLSEKSTEMSVMLDHLEQGVFTFNPDLTINREYSKRAPVILGVEDVPGAKWEDILPVDSATLDAFRQWVELMSGPRGVRSLERFARLNPIQEIVRGTENGVQYLTLTCRPIARDGRIWRFLVLVTDVTEQRRSRTELEEKRLAQQRESERIVALVRSDRSEIEDLSDRCSDLLQSFRVTSLDELLNGKGAAVKRAVHTLKGDTGSFGFSGLSACLAEVEEHLFPSGGVGANPEAWAGTVAGLDVELTAIENWRARLFAERGDRLSVDREIYQSLVNDVASGAVKDLTLVLERLDLLPARRLRDQCRRYQYIVEQYRRAYHKDLADLRVETPDVAILPQVMRTLDSCIVQLLRNAMDHGIESDQERLKARKGPGLISIAARYVDDSVEITLSDDGGGIDEAAVVAAAIRSGAATPEGVQRLTPEERIRLILRPGVTTRVEAGEISGRGVGLDAVAEEMRSRGGSLHIESRPGRGSSMTLRLPIATQ
jgi:HAMP domain-containing protein/signal transduction histidine kinase